MTPLQFAARCAIGLVFDIQMSVVRIDTGLNERVSVFWRLPRVHSVKSWEMWREVFGVSVAEHEREFSSAEWEDAILSALTEKHATATHIALPDGSVPQVVTDARTEVHRVGEPVSLQARDGH